MLLLILFMLSSCLTGIMTKQFQSLSVMQAVDCFSSNCELVLSSNSKKSHEKLCDMKKNEWKFSETKSNWLTDFRLICGQNYLINLETSVYFLGFFVSALLIGYSCDRYGRRLISICCFPSFFVLLLMLKYAVHLDKIFLLRFFAGGMHSCLSVSLLVTLAEFNTQKNLWICSILGSIAFSIGKTIISYMAYDDDQWQNTFDVPICIVIAALGLCYVVMPETPFWFYANGKELQSLVSLNEVAIVNRSLLLKDVSLVNHHRIKEDHYAIATIAVTLKTSFLRLPLLRLALCWFTAFSSYFILDNDIKFMMDSNEYLEMMVVGISEVPLQIVMFFTVQNLGRKKAASIFFALLAIVMSFACVPTSILDNTLSLGTVSTKAVVLTIAKGCAGSLLPLLTVYTCELLPTLSRCTGLSLCLMAGSSSSLLFPFIATLDTIMSTSHQILLVLLAVGSVVVLQRVPDTWNNPLPNNLTECETLFSKRDYNVTDELEMETLLTYNSDDD